MTNLIQKGRIGTVNNQPLVSIIMIFLNESEFIREAIESVLYQTYLHWELILIDDGSDDASSGIAKHYTGSFGDRIRYFEHPDHQNRGTSASRNLGLRQARGEFIAFLDADDLWLPFKLAAQVPLLLSQPVAAMLYGTTLFWHMPDQRISDPKKDFVQNLGVPPYTLIDPPKLLTLLLQNEDIHPTNCSLLIRRKLFEDIGGFEEEFRGLYEDTVFLAKAYLKARVFITGECSAIYRQHSTSDCHLAIETGQFHESEPNPARGAFLRWLERYLVAQRVRNRDVWQALRHELWPYEHPSSFKRSQRVTTLWSQIRGLRKHFKSNMESL
jgi:glycosyltransferase involved in cell wall biosynthesis